MTPRRTGFRSFATLLICRYRVSFGSTVSAPGYQHINGAMRMPNFGCDINRSMNQSRNISSNDFKKTPEPKIREEKDTSNVNTSNPTPRPSIFSWAKWVLGSILPLLFSFWNKKWDNMLKLEGKVEKFVNETEEVAEVVEKIASTTEKLSAEVAEKLDNDELKEAALMVEHVSSVTANDARITQDFIHKVGNLKQDLGDLETMVEPIIDKIEHRK